MSENNTCECMDELIEKINEKYPDKYHNLTAQQSLSFTTGKSDYYFNLSYRKKKKTGEFVQKHFDLPIIMSNCPLCGRKHHD